MNFKKIKKGFSLLLMGFVLFSLGSCDTDDLLEKEPITDLNEATGIQTEADIEAIINGAYDVLQWQVINGPSTHMHPIIFQEIRSDNCISQWASYWAAGVAFDDFDAIQPNNTSVLSLWRKWYTAVARANTAIEFATNYDGLTTSESKERLIAEAKFVRAFAYFELVKHWGDVPLITDYVATTEDQLIYSRSPKSEIYIQIENDLDDAVKVLGTKAEMELGRATKGAAHSLLAKVHLYQGEYQDVVTNCEAVMALDYELEENFADNWSLDNEYGKESIFEIGYADGFFSADFESDQAIYNQGSSSYQMFGFIFNSSDDVPGNGGFGNCVPRKGLIDMYDDADVRKDATFITPETVFDDIGPAVNGTDIYQFFWVNPAALETKASMRKYHLPARVTRSILNMGASPLNEKVLRYADVLLMHAEAVVMGATGADGQASLDKVRARAGLSSIPLTVQNVKDERRRELATEGWDRFTDLVRWGDAASVLAFKNFSTGRDELLPIPQSEINLVGKEVLDQNPGY
ncbi:RagB/SusD family nutrient uptake outer membrane protein [Marinifilum sp.]|uniref:RagB/SusD family nutrient uptake outer membrane protein n=1 Tax=Marinifilum sp. TaxID=2033137 RepID=UPI003BA8E921